MDVFDAFPHKRRQQAHTERGAVRAVTDPRPVARAVVALQHPVDQAGAALEQRVRVAQLQQPVAETAARDCAGVLAHLLERDV